MFARGFGSGVAPPAYLTDNPHIARAAPQIAAMVAEMRSHVATVMDATVELEARFGRLVSNSNPRGRMRFVPGVDEPTATRILNTLESFTEWAHVSPWVETQDFFYDAGDDGPAIRTTVRFDPESETVERVHTRKHPRQKQDLRFASIPPGGGAADAAGAPRGPHDVRVTLSIEENVPAERLPPVVRPTKVRIKQRKSFHYTPTGFRTPVWAFDVTMVWQGSSKAEAEQAQKNQPPVFEVECECIDPAAYTSVETHDDLFVATSLLLKMTDFFDDEREFSLEPIHPWRPSLSGN